MLPGTEVWGTPGWLMLLVFRFDPVVTPVFKPVPVAVVDDEPGVEMIPPAWWSQKIC